MKKNTFHYLCLFLFIIIYALFTCIFVFSETNEKTKTVKVGYITLDNWFMEGKSNGSGKSGYGYEYLQDIAAYTGWKYEYVYGDWDELYKKLVSGEIDLLPKVAYSKSRSKDIFFPNKKMGTENYYLFEKKDNESISEDLSSLNGKTIGIRDETSQMEILSAWLAVNNIRCGVYAYTTKEERQQAVDSGILDMIFDSDLDLEKSDNIKIAAKIETSDYYLAVSKKRGNLLDSLNEALAFFDEVNPNYLDDLKNKYYISSLSFNLSQKEAMWLDSHKTIKIGLLQDFQPYSAVDFITPKVHKGIAFFFIEQLKKDFNLHNSDVEYKFYLTEAELKKALTNDDVDVIFPSCSYLWQAENNGFLISDKIASASMCVLYNASSSNSSFVIKEDSVIASYDKNYMAHGFIEKYYPDSRNKMIYFDSLEKAVGAVLDGDADCIIMDDFLALKLMQGGKLKLNRIVLPEIYDVCFTMKKDDIQLRSIINKELAVINKTLLSNEFDRCVALSMQYSSLDFIKDNYKKICVFLICFILCIVVFVLSVKGFYYLITFDAATGLFRHRKIKRYLKAAHKSACRGKDTYSLLLIDIDDFDEKKKSYGHSFCRCVLKNISKNVIKSIHIGDLVFRNSSSEILVLCRCDDDDCYDTAELIRHNITLNPVLYKKGNERITVTIGLVSYWKDSAVDEVLFELMENVKRGKNMGKNQIVR